ncbi:MAG: serine/threonine protein kinase [Mariniblastus sp.]
MRQTEPTDDQLIEIQERCEEFIRMLREGTAPTQEQFAAQFPELETHILELLPPILLMEGARGRNFQKRKDGRVQRGPEEIVQLGDYNIIQELGRGGMGIVYEANQVSLDRRVALKVLPKHSLSPRQVEKFFLEASTAAKLHHTNIAPIYDVGTHDGFHYFSMQLLKGTSLESYVQSSTDASRFRSEEDDTNYLTIKEVVDIGRQVASALQYAHNQGVYHRDIKPANLVRDSGSNVWVTDFGLAVTQGQKEFQDETFSGTLRYMPPEKFRTKQIASTASSQNEGQKKIPTQTKSAPSKTNKTFEKEGEVYSLGLTLIELLSGSSAFPSVGVVELVEDVAQGRMVDFQHDGRPLPSDLEAVLRKSVALDPSERYSTIAEFSEDLENFLESRPVKAVKTNLAGTVFRWVKRNLALAIVSALATYLVIVVSAISTSNFLSTRSQINTERLRRLRSEESVLTANSSFANTFKPYSAWTVFGEGTLSSLQNAPKLSKSALKVLTAMSDEYLLLAGDSLDLPKISADSNQSLCIVADLHLLMADFDSARNSYQIALEHLEEKANEATRLDDETALAMALRSSPFSVDSILHLARVNNQLGIAIAGSRNVDGESVEERLNKARQHHIAALKSLEPQLNSKTTDPRTTFELARTLYLLGRTTRTGYRPDLFPSQTEAAHELATQQSSQSNGSSATTVPSNQLSVSDLQARRAYINRVLLVLQSFDKKDRYTDENKRLLALCQLEKAKFIRETETDDRAAEQFLNSAQTGLRDLIERHPELDNLKSDMISVLIESEPSYESLSQASGYSLRMSEDGNVLPIFMIQQIRLHRDLAKTCNEKAIKADAGLKEEILKKEESNYRRSLEIHRTLTGNSHTISSEQHKGNKSNCHDMWSAKFLLDLASCESLNDQPEERNKYVGNAITILHNLPEEILNKADAATIMQRAKLMSRQSLFRE